MIKRLHIELIDRVQNVELIRLDDLAIDKNLIQNQVHSGKLENEARNQLNRNLIRNVLVELDEEFQFDQVLFSSLQICLHLLSDEVNDFENGNLVFLVVDAKDYVEDAIALVDNLEILPA